MSPPDKMLFSDILLALRNATPTGRRSPIVFRHKDIELQLLAEKVRDRLVPWSDAWRALDESMPFDLERPRSSIESITVDSLFNLVERVVPGSERNAVLARLSGKLSYLKLGPWEVLDFLAEEHFVEKERDEYQ
jgi:hypothetical protein